ncbi:hypothetical protein [Vibrio aquaticus]|uniref:hypothetical protein n=1 Tax=Vibrio aquaticus TaxID=2496559 RepID=UPI00142DBD0A|nr:hypothetical protein [Vibrio aquaticus]
MVMVELSYQVMGIGKWTQVNVSEDVAQALLNEYQGYGWPVKLTAQAKNNFGLQRASQG